MKCLKGFSGNFFPPPPQKKNILAVFAEIFQQLLSTCSQKQAI
jgi:hypothetical protein